MNERGAAIFTGGGTTLRKKRENCVLWNYICVLDGRRRRSTLGKKEHSKQGAEGYANRFATEVEGGEMKCSSS